MAIFTGTLWLSTLLLWWATRGTLKHAKETTELDERGYRIDKKRARYHEHGNGTFRDASPSRAQVNSPGRRPAATDDRPTQRGRRYHFLAHASMATPPVEGAFLGVRELDRGSDVVNAAPAGWEPPESPRPPTHPAGRIGPQPRRDMTPGLFLVHCAVVIEPTTLRLRLALCSRAPAGRGMRAAATTTDRRGAGLFRAYLQGTS